jgi:hypothetical protein
MATWDDVRDAVAALPETFEQSDRTWRVAKKPLVWARPLRPADHRELGETAPQGPILGARVPDLEAKEELLTRAPHVYFTTSHFDGYPIVLALLERIDIDELQDLVVEAWLAQAPKRVAAAWLESHPDGPT